MFHFRALLRLNKYGTNTSRLENGARTSQLPQLTGNNPVTNAEYHTGAVTVTIKRFHRTINILAAEKLYQTPTFVFHHTIPKQILSVSHAHTT